MELKTPFLLKSGVFWDENITFGLIYIETVLKAMRLDETAQRVSMK